MKKTRTIGSIAIIAAGLLSILIGFLLINSGVSYIPKKSTAIAIVVLAVAWIPTFISYFIWYGQCVKADLSATAKRPGPVVPCLAGIVISIAIAVVVTIVVCFKDFSSIYPAAIESVLVAVAGALAFFAIGKP